MQKKYPVLENNRFVNYSGETTHSFFWKSVYMYLCSLIARFYHKDSDAQRLKRWHVPFASLDTPFGHSRRTDLDSVQATWIGHASFLIQVGGFAVLTDPVFGNLSFLFQRTMAPGIGLANLPAIDAVVISHNHRDHLDEHAIKAIFKSNPACQFFVPFGDKAWFMRRGITNVTECMWWDTETIVKNDFPLTLPQSKGLKSSTLTVQFLPAYHWSQRGLFDRNKSLWGSWLIKADGQTIYFAGDTAFSSHFKQISHEVGAIDLALLPIGPCEPYEWMKFSHMNAEEAGKAFFDLQARTVIPMHWGTYRFGTDSIFGPLDRFTTWWNAHQTELAHAQLFAPACGKTVIIPSAVMQAVPVRHENHELQQ